MAQARAGGSLAHAPAWLDLASAAVAAASTRATDVVLVAHSGAGRLVAGVRGDYRAIVLVDAGLPGEPTHRAGAPPEFDELIAQLAQRADPADAGLPGHPRQPTEAGHPGQPGQPTDAGQPGQRGVLPPWPEWWPPAALEALVPDPDRRRLLADAPRVPVALFDEPLPAECAVVPSHVHVSFLAYGDGYAEEAAEAARRGWPVERIEGMHLHHLVDPDAVAAAIVRLAGP